MSTTSVVRAQSKPTAATRVPISCARSSDGSAFGTPREQRPRLAGVLLFARLDLLPLLDDLAAACRRRAASPKTCGWRRISFSLIARSESATVNRPSSSAILRQEDAFEDEVADLAAKRVVIAAIDRVEDLVRFFEHELPRSDSSVCSRSQGQPPGPRSRAMMSTSFWNASPADRS